MCYARFAPHRRFNCLRARTEELTNGNRLDFVAIQGEICPRTGKTHGQISMGFSKVIRRKTIKEIFMDNSLHLQPKAKFASIEQMIDYGLGENGSDNSKHKDKPGIFMQGKIFGDVPQNKQGERNDIVRMRDALREGATMRDLILGEDEEMVRTCLRNTRAVELCETLCAVPRDSSVQPKVFLVIGSRGCGKTRWAMEKFPGACLLSLSNGGSANSIWFDEYINEDTIIFDDFRGQLPILTMMRMIDRQPFLLQQKGVKGGRQLRATRFVLTSNKQPGDWYPNADPVNVDALMDRLKPPGPNGSERGWGTVVTVSGGKDQLTVHESQDASLLRWTEEPFQTRSV